MPSPKNVNEALLPCIQQQLENTPSLLPLTEPLALAASHDVPILLTGETGTGKSHLGGLIHACSPRHDQPLLIVPCGALTPHLLRSEFFGHAKGAFTGADSARIGKFEAAGSGTLLLDEIDVLPLEDQAALLRVIETGAFESVGSNETKHCRARIIVASNWNLEEAIQQGKFRQDLYYRLNVMSFHLPPLRERQGDIELLARDMVSRFANKFRKGLTSITPEALRVLKEFRWPGNIRQLENILQQAVLISSGTGLLVEHLPFVIRGDDRQVLSPAPIDSSSLGDFIGGEGNMNEQTLSEHLDENEREMIKRALEAAGYSRNRTASVLGITRISLYKKMKKYGLLRKSFQ